MQRREFIAAVGVVAAVSQSNPIYAQPIGAVAHRTILANGIHLHFAEQGNGRESDSGWSASYATLRSALRVQTTPTVKLFAPRRWSDARHCSMRAGTRSYGDHTQI
jgi:hypothetical protein